MSTSPAVIYCQDHAGQLFPVPVEAISEGTAVFGLLIEGQKILLQIDPKTGLLALPGGRLDHNQTFDQGLRQLFRGATGADTVSGELVLVTHTYHKSDQGGIKMANLFYRLFRASHNQRHFIDFDNPLNPQWIPLRDIKRKTLLNGYDAIQVAAALVS